MNNKLPKYIVASDSSVRGDLVIQTEYPYIVAMTYRVEVKDTEGLVRQAAIMREGAFPMVKVDGFTVFLTRWTTLEGARVDRDETMQVLREMADYYLAERIMGKRGNFRRYDEERISDGFYERAAERGRHFRALKEERRRQEAGE